MFSLKSQKLRFIFLSIFLGIFLGRDPFLPQYILLLGLIFFSISFVFRQYLLFVMALFCFGDFYGQYRTSSIFYQDILPQFYDEKIELTGWVKNFPDMREKNNRVFLQVTKINGSRESFEGIDLGTILFIYPPEKEIDYGDEVKVSGKLQKPRNFDGFDYSQYLKRFGVRTILKTPNKMEILSRGENGHKVILLAKRFRNFLAKNLSQALPTPHDQIAMGILLGVKKELPEDVSQNFKNSGLTHILVVSGFNVTVLMVFCAIVLKRFGRRIIFVGSSITLLFFCLMVGGDPPVLRATIFGAIVGWAIVSGKISDSRNLLYLTAVILAIISPQMVQRDVGFFLSFFATFGIILFLPIFQEKFVFLPERFEFRSIVSVIVAAQLSVFPILGLYFGSFPFMGFLANILIEPLIPLAMGFSFLTTIFYPILGVDLIQVLAYPAKIILSVILFLADLFGRFEGIVIPRFVAIGGLCVVLLFFFWGSFSFWYQQKFLEE